ncbi:helix-turn-helix domain-containing protein [Pseudarthrobacter sp. AL07]|uniref:helix-turn-helix domain-containing protein n=1 Tax=unclassified Pseudarthrobacter TaxID=2647000 RepID=UPI00249A6ABF|nr:MULTISPECIES: helix-turn-helix domain-containing protein [unclassified Pseudarthrobacter]MDI3196033.1 helix-turn-helix domain-containing protein [Pseudarthrobacter sp. AL20]MDI3210104.1 helix-turn-helix domain-containing protein [Pseudarthrobacter sp. AL07]
MTLSERQTYRLVGQNPDRISFQVLVALCDIFKVEANTHRYGQCPLCGADRTLPGRTDAGEDTCRECASITTDLTCDNFGREAERFRGGRCITSVLTTNLTELLRPNDLPGLRLNA